MKNGLLALLVWILSLTLLAALLSLCDDARADSDTDTDTNVLTKYVDWFHRTMKSRYAARAKRLIPATVRYCREYDVDPLLMGVIYSKESSWRNFKGALDERGPGHVKPSKWSRQFNLATLDGQIEAAVARMRVAHDACRGLMGALTHYASGSCVARTPTTTKIVRWRVNAYRRAVRRFR